MRISFERTGGFAGMIKTKTFDSAELPENEANRLPKLVEAANFYNLPPDISVPPNQPDRFQYTLTVEQEDRKHTVTVNEAAVPGDLKPLVEWLKNN